MKTFRFTCYSIALVLLVIPLIPLPFAKPDILHDIFSRQAGGLLVFLLLGFLALCIIGIFSGFAYYSIQERKINRDLLIELLFIPLCLTFFLTVLTLLRDQYSPPAVIFSINNGRNSADFVNPYLAYKMVDCRNQTEEFDVVFIPPYLLTETDYLAYAPRRLDKSIGGYRWGRKYGDDWYWEPSGSQWSNDLRNCVHQSKFPNT